MEAVYSLNVNPFLIVFIGLYFIITGWSGSELSCTLFLLFKESDASNCCHHRIDTYMGRNTTDHHFSYIALCLVELDLMEPENFLVRIGIVDAHALSFWTNGTVNLQSGWALDVYFYPFLIWNGRSLEFSLKKVYHVISSSEWQNMIKMLMVEREAKGETLSNLSRSILLLQS